MLWLRYALVWKLKGVQMKADQRTWDDALAACFKAILEDDLSVEQALSHFPDIANDLRPELDAALWLRQQRQALSAYKWEIGLSRRRLENRLLLQRPDWHTYWRRLNILQRGFQMVSRNSLEPCPALRLCPTPPGHGCRQRDGGRPAEYRTARALSWHSP